MLRKLFLVILFLFSSSIAVVSAQMSTAISPLLQMLARVPNTATGVGDDPSYIDYQALFAARPGAPKVNSWQDYQNLTGADSALFLSAIGSIVGGPSLYQYYNQAAQMPDAVGFDLFTIERGFVYGDPPKTVTILQGDFDSAAIIAAHEKRGYTQTSISGGLTQLCPANGCPPVAPPFATKRNLANPFGGYEGLNQPVIVGDHLVASSQSSDPLNLSASTIAGTTPSLADQPDYRAAAEAIASAGTVLEAEFINATSIGGAASSIVNSSLGASPTEIAQLPSMISTAQASFVPLPQYNLIAIADTVTKDEERALVALVYTDSSQAQAAAALLPDRFQKYVTKPIGKPSAVISDLLTQQGVTSVDTSVYNASTNRAVLLLTIHSPLPGSTVPEDGSKPLTLARAFRILVDGYYSRDLNWLATQF